MTAGRAIATIFNKHDHRIKGCGSSKDREANGGDGLISELSGENRCAPLVQVRIHPRQRLGAPMSKLMDCIISDEILVLQVGAAGQ